VDGTAGGCSTPARDAETAAHPRSAGPAGYRHTAGLARSWEHLVALAVPFVADGLRAGDLTVLSCAPATAARIRAELGEEASRVCVEDRLTLVGCRPPDAMAAMRRLAGRAAGTGSGRLRVLAEVRVHGVGRDLREGERYESASNAVLAASPVSSLCLYDGSRLPAGVAEGVRATHPLLVDGDRSRPNTAYRDPREHVRSLPVPREPVEAAPPALVVDDARSLPDLRHALAAVVDTWVRDPEQREDLRLGLAEVAANAFRHGRRPVSARVWVDPRRIVCTVADRGGQPVDPLAGFVPAHGDDLGRGGMGLWLARKLFDSVDLLAGPHGFTVRLAADLR
jgi:anti-sigma regulatory factor (Ser/Thr protein kinase)